MKHTLLIRIGNESVLLIFTEKTVGKPTECEACSRRLGLSGEEGAYSVSMICGAEHYPLDGLFCCEDCAIEEAARTNFVQATHKETRHVTATSH